MGTAGSDTLVGQGGVSDVIYGGGGADWLLSNPAVLAKPPLQQHGVFRLDHDAGQHDDRAVALGLATLALTEHPRTGRGSIWCHHLPCRRF
jgi:hypothetical protein